MRLPSFLTLPVALGGMAGSAFARPDEGENRFHLGSHSRRFATNSEAAQRAFDRGLELACAFDHRAAEAAFREAVAADPTCAMAWWASRS